MSCAHVCVRPFFSGAKRSRRCTPLSTEFLIMGTVNYSLHALLTRRRHHAANVLQHHLSELEVRDTGKELPGRLHGMLLGNHDCVCARVCVPVWGSEKREGEGKWKAVHLCRSHAPHSGVLLHWTLNTEEQWQLQVWSRRLAECVVIHPPPAPR